jgi:hypothetical protein
MLQIEVDKFRFLTGIFGPESEEVIAGCGICIMRE